jgi:flavodoxin
MKLEAFMSRKLVAYFSASGVTAKVAEKLSEAIGADLYAIEPEVPYTKADLDWMDKKSRSTIEMNNPASRPAIAGKRDNMNDYDTVFVGFPIWWYVAPTIINTFLESYDLTGKTIIPFATSGGSDMGKTNEKLLPSCKGAKLLKGKVFKASVSGADLAKWAEGLENK